MFMVLLITMLMIVLIRNHIYVKVERIMLKRKINILYGFASESILLYEKCVDDLPTV